MTRIFSHLHGDQQIVHYSDIIGTITGEDNSDGEDEMEIALSKSQPPCGDGKLLSYFDSDRDRKPCNSKLSRFRWRQKAL